MTAKKIAVLLTAAVALATLAYALGSQAGNGGALASGSSAATPAPGSSSGVAISDRRGFGHRGGFGLANLADRLGVSRTALRDALDAIRSTKTFAQRRADFVAALATALGKPVDQVTSAVDSVLPDRDRRKGQFAAALASRLGVTTAQVQTALDDLRSDLRGRRFDRRGRRGDFRSAIASALATRLGVSADRVRRALDDLRGQFRRDHRGRDRDDVRSRLASALGVTDNQLETALDKAFDAQRDAFAAELAQRLNSSVDKVRDVLDDTRGFFFGRRHG